MLPPPASPRRILGLRLTTLAYAIVLAIGLAASVAGYVDGLRVQSEVRRLGEERDAARRALQVATELEVGVRGYLVSGRADHLRDYHRALDRLRAEWDGSLAAMDADLRLRGLSSLHEALARSLDLRARAVDLYETEGAERARAFASRGNSLFTTDQVRELAEAYVADHVRRIEDLGSTLAQRQLLVLGLIVMGGFGSISLMGFARRQAERRGDAAARSLAEAEAARDALDRKGREVEALFRMDELLQSGAGMADVCAVVAHTAAGLLPGHGGALFAFNNSRDRLDLAAAWAGQAAPAPTAPPSHFGAAECWALKRGRPHQCGIGGDLRCDHAVGPDGESGRCLCLPMTARGEVFGVLQLYPAEGNSAAGVREDELALAVALADGISLALANLALRERLKGQALRDPLTGLYNRRFLDEMVDRAAAQAERRGGHVAVLMLDLDHFKQVNDRYGHAVGDAALRDVAAMLQGRLRRSDVACRYGGEEMLILMPDCSIADATARAEDLRNGVAGLHDGDGSALPRLTVSIGVATFPDNGRTMEEVIRAADEALYAAKRGGRNRVVAAAAPLAIAEHAQVEELKVAAE